MTAAPERRRDGWVKAWTLAALVLGYIGVVALNTPGHLSYDSVLQLLDGRTGRFHTWHPPVMAWLLGLADGAVRGTGLYVAGQAALLFGALAVLVLRAGRVHGWAPLVVLALLALPQVLLWQAAVWKDVLFADATVAGFVALSAGEGLRGRARWMATAVGLLLLALATLVRQNGLLVLLAGAAALGASLSREARSQQAPARAWAAAAAALALILASVWAASAAFNARSVDGDGARAQVRSVQMYDLAGAVARDPRLPLEHLPPAIAVEFRARAPQLYTPLRLDPIQGDPRYPAWTMDHAGLEAQWRDLVLRRPDLWLRHRLAVARWMWASPAGERCFSDVVGVDGEPDALAQLGLAEGQTPRDLALARYAAGFHRTPVYMHGAYAVAAAALAIWLLRRGRTGDLAFAGLLLGVLAFAASFLLIGVACDYRYLYALDLAVLVAGFRAAATAADADATRPTR